MAEFQDYVEMALTSEEPLKLILKGWMEENAGVVAVVYATLDKEKARQKFEALNKNKLDAYYMIYSVPFDTDLNQLEHYPSLGISRQDFD